MGAAQPAAPIGNFPERTKGLQDGFWARKRGCVTNIVNAGLAQLWSWTDIVRIQLRAHMPMNWHMDFAVALGA